MCYLSLVNLLVTDPISASNVVDASNLSDILEYSRFCNDVYTRIVFYLGSHKIRLFSVVWLSFSFSFCFLLLGEHLNTTEIASVIKPISISRDDNGLISEGSHPACLFTVLRQYLLRACAET